VRRGPGVVDEYADSMVLAQSRFDARELVACR
jgi:hypothetical protein